MKNLILLFSLFIGLSSFTNPALASENLIKGKCFVQANTYEDLMKHIDRDSALWGILTYPYLGEIDLLTPDVEGFFSLASAFAVYIIYEEDGAHLTRVLQENVRKGYEYLALDPQCLTKLKHTALKYTLYELADRPYGKVEYYQIK